MREPRWKIICERQGSGAEGGGKEKETVQSRLAQMTTENGKRGSTQTRQRPETRTRTRPPFCGSLASGSWGFVSCCRYRDLLGQPIQGEKRDARDSQLQVSWPCWSCWLAGLLALLAQCESKGIDAWAESGMGRMTAGL